MRLPLIAAMMAAGILAAPAGASLKTGAKAPDFTTRGAVAGKPFQVHLAQQLKKGPVVLYFFPAAFTNTHFLTATRFVAKKDKGLTKTDDLKGRTVVSTSGTTNIRQINEINTARGLGMRILPAKDHAEAFLMVETGRADAFVMDDVLLAALVAGSKTPDAYAISSEAQSRPEPYGIMLRKDDPAFKAVVDAATAALYRSPEGRALYEKWFTQPIPPRGINLKLPMSEAMQKVFANPSDSPDPAAY